MGIAQTHNGIWYVQYRIPGTSSPQKEYFGKGESARTKAEERKEEISRGNLFTIGMLSAQKTIYLDELGQCYLDVMRATGKTESWIKVLIYLLNDHFLPCMNSVPVDQLTFQDVLNVAKRFSSNAASTQNRYMDSLHAIFRFGIEHDMTTNDPMKHWKKNRESKRDVQLTVNDLSKLYLAAPEHLQWILEVEWELGTRPGVSELFSLKWSDIDFERNLIRVRGTKTKGSDRLIPMTVHFKDRLLEKHALAKSDYVIEYNGKKITNCRTSFKNLCEKVQLKYPIRLYDIRHLFASTMLVNGGDLKAVSKLLGHSSTRMTADIYYHELKGEKLKALSSKPTIMI